MFQDNFYPDLVGHLTGVTFGEFLLLGGLLVKEGGTDVDVCTGGVCRKRLSWDHVVQHGVAGDALYTFICHH